MSLAVAINNKNSQAVTDAINSLKDKQLSIEIQLKLVQGLKDQVNCINNPENLPDYRLQLRISKRRLGNWKS